MNFKDHFSAHAADYATARPKYPRELFAWLAEISPQREMAWDVGTGNGQAAVELAEFFEKVIATDPSAEQLAAAVPHARVEYRRQPAEDSGLAAGSVDLITVAQALHWFDFVRFYAEVRRVARPDAILAAWCYELHSISPEIDAVIQRFYTQIVGPYWPSERRFIEEGYRTLPFPFPELAVPRFEMQIEWEFGQLLGYLNTWSAVRRYQKERGENPLDRVADSLAQAWGKPEQRRMVRWPLVVKAGKVK